MRNLPDNPQENASFISKLLFYWTIPLFKELYSKVLEIEDIYKPLKVDHSEFLGNQLEE